MSRIGKKELIIPQGVTLTLDAGFIVAKGPKGELRMAKSPLVDCTIENGVATMSLSAIATLDDSKMWGLMRALTANMVKGVSEGFEKTLEFSGVGYKAVLKPDGSLELSLGFSHTIPVKAIDGISFKVEKNSIQIIGIDREKIGHVAALIRSFRPPEPYNGSGIRYKGEVIKKKAGKKATSTA